MKTVFFFVAIFIILSCSAQRKYGIVNSYGFSQVVYPGNIPGDQPHVRPDTAFIVYMEIKKAILPQWKSAIILGKPYKVLTEKVASPAQVGIVKGDNDSAVISTAKSNYLWRLSLEKTSSFQDSKKCLKTKTASILLKGRSKKKTVYYTVDSIKELLPQMNE